MSFRARNIVDGIASPARTTGSSLFLIDASSFQNGTLFGGNPKLASLVSQVSSLDIEQLH